MAKDVANYEQIREILAPHLPDNVALSRRPAGRPAYHGEALVKVTLTLPPEYRDYIREVGSGNMSLGARNIITRDMAQHGSAPIEKPSDPGVDFSMELFRRAVAKVRDNKELRNIENILTGEYWFAGDEYWMWIITTSVEEILETVTKIRDERDEEGETE